MKTSSPRRDFIKKLGLGTAALTLPSIANSTSQNKNNSISKIETEKFLNGFDFEFQYSGENFLGIGAVSIDKINLRSNKLPMFVQITTPDALELVNFKVLDKKISVQSIVIEFSAEAKTENTMEWMLHTVRNRRRIGDWTKNIVPASDIKLKLEIKPVERMLGKTLIKGFSYQYFYQSTKMPVYKITDRSSWEIGGNATGNELWMRNGVVDSIKEFKSSDDFYSTEWYLPGIANPNIFQFHPLQTQLQGFTFTSANEGTLITWASKVEHIRSLFEKWKGYDQIVHIHEHCNDLLSEFTTSPMEVLWIPGKLDRVGRANLYNEMRELVHGELHSQIGMKRERITTYGVIEEWTEPDFDKYTKTGLPKLLETGVKTIFIPSQCENDMNVWGVSNMCCNVDFKIAKTVGEDKLKKFCQAAKTGGARVEMWGNTAISTLTERFMHPDGQKKGINFLPYKNSIMEVIDKAESPFIRNASNAIEADHYTPRFCALNLRDKDIRAYWMKQWKYFHDELGINGIFLDSSFNMSSDKFHHAQFDGTKGWSGATMDQKELLMKYRPENEPPKLIHTQYHEHLSWVVEMQKTGYQYCAEDMGVFGINRTGPDVVDRISSFPIWAESYCRFNEKAIKNAGYQPIDIFFKGLAYRMMWMIMWDIERDKLQIGIDNPLAFNLIKVYNKVTDLMFNREILENEKGVVYKKNKTRILWAFEDFSFALNPNEKVEELNSGNNIKVSGNKEFKALKNKVYLIQS